MVSHIGILSTLFESHQQKSYVLTLLNALFPLSSGHYKYLISEESNESRRSENPPFIGIMLNEQQSEMVSS